MKKRTKVIMLPTDKASDIHLGLEGGYIYYKNGKLAEERTQPQHLYFISDERLKSKGWGIHSDTNELFQYEEDFYNPWVYKIIATTDILKIKEVDSFEFGSPQDEYYVPQIPQSFIEEYCRKGGIEYVDADVVGRSKQLAEHKCKFYVNAEWTYLKCECGQRLEPKG